MLMAAGALVAQVPDHAEIDALAGRAFEDLVSDHALTRARGLHDYRACPDIVDRRAEAQPFSTTARVKADRQVSRQGLPQIGQRCWRRRHGACRSGHACGSYEREARDRTSTCDAAASET